jgi:hypothetical protein
VGTIYKSTSYIDRGTIPPVQVERIGGRGRTGDIHDGIDRAHFMEVNLLGRNAVDATLCLRQQGKGAQAEVAGALGQVCTLKELTNLRQAATVLMFMLMVVSWVVMVMLMMAVVMVLLPMAVVMVMLMMAVLVLYRPGIGWGLMQFAVDHDIDLGGLNPAPVCPGDPQFRAWSQRSRGPLQQFYGSAGIYQRAHEHIAADTGKALQVADAHSLAHPRPPLFKPVNTSMGSTSFMEPER